MDDPISALIAQKNAEAEAQRRLQSEALLKASAADAPPTTGQAISQGIIGVLPLLAGMALKGKEGVYAGALGGLAGIKDFDAKRKEQSDAERKIAAAQAQIYGQQATAADRIAESANLKKLFKEEFPSKGTSITVENKIEGEGSKFLTKEILEAELAKDSLKANNDEIRAAIDAIIAKGGKLDETWVEASLRNVGAAIEPNSEAGRLRRATVRSMLEQLNSLNKGTPSERDRELQEIVTGSNYNISLGTMQEIANRIDKLAEERITKIERIASRRGLMVPVGAADEAGQRFSIDPSMDLSDPDTLQNLKTAAAQSGVPIVQVKQKGGGLVDAYDFGPGSPPETRYLSVK